MWEWFEKLSTALDGHLFDVILYCGGWIIWIVGSRRLGDIKRRENKLKEIEQAAREAEQSLGIPHGSFNTYLRTQLVDQIRNVQNGSEKVTEARKAVAAASQQLDETKKVLEERRKEIENLREENRRLRTSIGFENTQKISRRV